MHLEVCLREDQGNLSDFNLFIDIWGKASRWESGVGAAEDKVYEV